LEVAAAGGHNVLMIGPPGSGKTMLAKRIPSILPSLTFEEALETTTIYSVAGLLPSDQPLITSRPFCSPHHTISDAGLIGGGTVPRPGQVSLAHNGVLFLDELPEFKKNVLESLRQPIEDGVVTISRASITLSFPARFTLVAAQNPCPCGHLGDSRHKCSCLPSQIIRYRNRISGPLLDRIDIQIEVPAVPYSELSQARRGEGSATIRKRVIRARKIQEQRFKDLSIHCNSQMSSKELRSFCKLSEENKSFLEAVASKLALSARAFHRIIKIGRTIADLEESTDVTMAHLSEAVQYRSLDRERI
jgi:magnesium chelatase family protein